MSTKRPGGTTFTLSNRHVQSMAFVIREISCSGGSTSYSKLVKRSELGLTRKALKQALATLQRHKVLEAEDGEKRKSYRLNTTSDFLVLSTEKRVRVAASGHRSVRVKNTSLSLKDGLDQRLAGSTVWKSHIESPRVRLGPTSRRDLLDGRDFAKPSFSRVESPNNDVKFQLHFDPPLRAGELVEYGFYLWNQNHYARSRKEALERFRDEWIREGLVVRDPTVSLCIDVKLPEGYKYQAAEPLRNIVFSGEGTALSQDEITLPHLFEANGRRLKLSVENPGLGNYFVCWIPPEQANLRIVSRHESVSGRARL